jgi:DNA-nicking Smr family endonuclease
MSRRSKGSGGHQRKAPPFEAVLDLHGLSQAAAYQRLKSFLAHGALQGRRCILVVVGKGAETDLTYEPFDPLRSERGILRRMVPLWLDTPDLQHLITGYKEALPEHGGRGALYVWIKKHPSQESPWL